MSQHRACVIVGAGLAAAHAVETLRADGWSDPIVLIGEEDERPYERPGLSKGVLLGQDEAETLFVHEEHWYAEHDVTTRFGERVERIDREAREVVLASGERIAYAALVLATGARPRLLDIPGADLAGVLTLRRMGDSAAIAAELVPGRRVVLVGAGWIGLEVAAAARLAGADVTVLEYAAQPLLRVLGDRLARHVAAMHRAHGVDLRTGVGVTAVEGAEGHVTGVRVGDGVGGDDEVVPADVVIVGVGAAPATELAEGAGLPVDNGIVVDTHLRTSDPAIWAAGDVANALNATLGPLRVEHWDNAIRQGKLVAASILGRDGGYDWQPYFYTDQYELGMEYVGRASGDDEVVIRGDLREGDATSAFIAFWQREGRVTAAMQANVWDTIDDLRALIGRVIPAERLRDEAIALSDL